MVGAVSWKTLDTKINKGGYAQPTLYVLSKYTKGTGCISSVTLDIYKHT